MRRVCHARAVEMLGLLVMLLMAGALRLGWPGIHSFGYDEARISLMALEMARGGEFATIGMPSSAGVPNPPAFVWLMALPYAISTDPLVASLLIGAINVAAVLGVWLLARQAWGPWAALTAGLLLASSPFAVFYSRSIWSQDLLVPLAVAWALAGVTGVRRNSGPLLAGHLFLAGFAGQVHYAGLVLVPASAWLVARYRLWRRWAWLSVGACTVLATLWPFLAAVAAELPTMVRNIGQGAGGPSLQAEAVLRWVEVAVGANWEWLPLGWAWRWPRTLGWAQIAARAASATLIGVGLVAVARQAWQTRHHTPEEATILANLIPAWALATPLVFLVSRTPVYPQYQLAALPALLMAAGAAARASRRRWSGPLVAALATAVALAQGTAAAISIEANRAQLKPGGLGTPLAYPRAATQALRDGLPIYVHPASDDPALDADAAGMSVLLWGYPHRIVDGSNALLLPPEGSQAHLLFPFPDLPAALQAERYAAVAARRALPRRHGEPPYLALTVHGEEPRDFRALEPVSLANGAILQGWDAYWQGEKLWVVTWWQISEALRPGRYHQFNHLYTATGATPHQVRDRPASSAAWEPGATLITWTAFEPELAGPYRLEVGMYAYPELERVPVVGAPTEAAQSIVLGVVE